MDAMCLGSKSPDVTRCGWAIKISLCGRIPQPLKLGLNQGTSKLDGCCVPGVKKPRSTAHLKSPPLAQPGPLSEGETNGSFVSSRQQRGPRCSQPGGFCSLQSLVKAPGAASQRQGWVWATLQGLVACRGLLLLQSEGTRCSKWLRCHKSGSYCSSLGLHSNFFATESQILLAGQYLWSHPAWTPA